MPLIILISSVLLIRYFQLEPLTRRTRRPTAIRLTGYASLDPKFFFAYVYFLSRPSSPRLHSSSSLGAAGLSVPAAFLLWFLPSSSLPLLGTLNLSSRWRRQTGCRGRRSFGRTWRVRSRWPCRRLTLLWSTRCRCWPRRLPRSSSSTMDMAGLTRSAFYGPATRREQESRETYIGDM
jgi:hypothetical protein